MSNQILPIVILWDLPSKDTGHKQTPMQKAAPKRLPNPTETSFLRRADKNELEPSRGSAETAKRRWHLFGGRQQRTKESCPSWTLGPFSNQVQAQGRYVCGAGAGPSPTDISGTHCRSKGSPSSSTTVPFGTGLGQRRLLSWPSSVGQQICLARATHPWAWLHLRCQHQCNIFYFYNASWAGVYIAGGRGG